MDPINYNIDVKSPFESGLKGFAAGSEIAGAMQKKQLQALELQQKLQMQSDLAALAQNPNAGAREYAAVMTKYPALAENLKRGWDVQSAEQQQNRLQQAGQVYAAMQSGRGDIAGQLLAEQATALRNAGNEQEAGAAEAMAKLIEMDPKLAKNSVGMRLAALLGPDKFATTFETLGKEGRAADQAPADLRKKEAEAKSAEVKAKYADQDALLDLEKKGWDIKAVKADIDYKKESNRIAAMNAAMNKEGNELKRKELQLKIDEAISTRDTKLRERVAAAETGAATIDNMLNTVQRIQKNKSLNSVLGSLEGNEFYPNATMGTLNPWGNGDERADAIALIDTLGSQAFLSQIPALKGTGSLSNAEGEKLQSSLQNLRRKQSEPQFRANLNEASRLLLKARENLSKSSGVPLAPPDTPAAPGARPPLDSFQR